MTTHRAVPFRTAHGLKIRLTMDRAEHSRWLAHEIEQRWKSLGYSQAKVYVVERDVEVYRGVRGEKLKTPKTVRSMEIASNLTNGMPPTGIA